MHIFNGKDAKLGKWKEAAMDAASERQGFFSQVAFECPKCGEDASTEVGVPEPDLSGEKTSDMTADGEVEVQCFMCQAVFDGYAYASPSHCDIELVDYPSTTVHADMPFYSSSNDPDDWEMYVVPEDPHEIFQSTIGPLRGILADYMNAHTQRLLTRMVFSQSITAFEAYFCDTLIKNVTAAPNAMKAVLKKDGSLSQARFSLGDVLASPDIVRREIEASLRNRLYHKVEDVARLYANALDISITPNRDDMARLKTDIGYRHDCVHRNGVNKEGSRLDVLTKEYVAETIEVVARFVAHTENQVRGDDWF